jgi:hypothetical protein
VQAAALHWTEDEGVSSPEKLRDIDFHLEVIHRECSENSCTPGKSPTAFLPAAYHQDDAPSGCKCTQTNLGSVFNAPSADWNDVLDTIEKYRSSGGQLGRMLRSIIR